MTVLNERFDNLNKELENARGKQIMAEDALAGKTQELSDYKIKNYKITESLNQKVSDLEAQLATVKENNELLDLEVLGKLFAFWAKSSST